MRASLMMYTTARTRDAEDRYWAALRRSLSNRHINAPETLIRTGDPIALWRAPDLLLSQTCGMPYRTLLHHNVQLVGTPDYGLPDCPPGYYRSVIVVRADDPRRTLSEFSGSTLAYNDALSQSGFAALYEHLSPAGRRFAETLCSGSHAASAQMVADGRADIAALDAQTWRLLCRDTQVAKDLRVLDQTPPTPGLPYITGPDQDSSVIRAAVAEAIAGLSQEDTETLGLRGIVFIPKAAYLAVPTPPTGILD